MLKILSLNHKKKDAENSFEKRSRESTIAGKLRFYHKDINMECYSSNELNHQNIAEQLQSYFDMHLTHHDCSGKPHRVFMMIGNSHVLSFLPYLDGKIDFILLTDRSYAQTYFMRNLIVLFKQSKNLDTFMAYIRKFPNSLFPKICDIKKVYPQWVNEECLFGTAPFFSSPEQFDKAKRALDSITILFSTTDIMSTDEMTRLKQDLDQSNMSIVGLNVSNVMRSFEPDEPLSIFDASYETYFHCLKLLLDDKEAPIPIMCAGWPIHQIEDPTKTTQHTDPSSENCLQNRGTLGRYPRSELVFGLSHLALQINIFVSERCKAEHSYYTASHNKPT